MKDIKEVNWRARDDQLNNDVLRRHRDEDIRDDDAITSDRVSDSKLPAPDPDDDDAGLKDNDVTGRDLDVENRDEWDAANVSDELNDSDLDDDDQLNADPHSVKNAKFGSLVSGVNPDQNPNPAEVPAENQPNREVTQPRKDNMEKGKNNESDFKHTKEVTPPQPEHERKTTLDNLDPSNVGIDHTRKTERMVDHEPGVAGDRKAPNL
ncbi:hypothetical protein BEL04_15905 [Mucilaginibacter sp. PPCGB 2223]|uniref:hypothetical protein n=1 Tax=Mucilaginibacter sp. PPCGB 2223 TaxID=1886027 RepID=UPI0008261AFD|nr:hypothetical protein [Mucilaginibacter sp. PPCGB 2223]OCX51508.1 hypothetical protein BEL04_15905 [Mucilaginibacter sp. PPCGB 2223]